MEVRRLTDDVTVYVGHCIDALRQLPANHVQCVVTSPPFWGLRDYGTAVWEGGDPHCGHHPAARTSSRGNLKGIEQIQANGVDMTRWWARVGGVCPECGARRVEPTVWGGLSDCEHEWTDSSYRDTRKNDDTAGSKQRSNQGSQGWRNAFRSNYTCKRCGAWRGQLGLEPSPELFVEHLVLVFQEVRRVLRPDGTVWLNLGDSYNASGATGTDDGLGGPREGNLRYSGRRVKGLKPKDLCLVPERVILALQADGWWVRSKPPWIKGNAMPESVTDRPGVAHENVFLLTKSGEPTFWVHRDLPGTRTKPKPDFRWIDKVHGYVETDEEPPKWKEERRVDGRRRWRRLNLWRAEDYYYDADAVRLPHLEASLMRVQPHRSPPGKSDRSGKVVRPNGHPQTLRLDQMNHPAGRNRRTTDWWNESLDELIESQRAYLAHLKRAREHGGMLQSPEGEPLGFMVNPEPLGAAHFATFPTRLVRPMIEASTSPRACPYCRAPWARRKGDPVPTAGRGSGNKQRKVSVAGERSRTNTHRGFSFPWKPSFTPTVDWRPTCACEDNDGSGKCIVLDPFLGSGTTALVAASLGREAIGVEQNPEYAEIAQTRLSSTKAQRTFDFQAAPALPREESESARQLTLEEIRESGGGD